MKSEGYLLGWTQAKVVDGVGDSVLAQVLLPGLAVNKDDDGIREFDRAVVVALGVNEDEEREALLAVDIDGDNVTLSALIGYLPNDKEVDAWLDKNGSAGS